MMISKHCGIGYFVVGNDSDSDYHLFADVILELLEFLLSSGFFFGGRINHRLRCHFSVSDKNVISSPHKCKVHNHKSIRTPAVEDIQENKTSRMSFATNLNLNRDPLSAMLLRQK